MMVELELKREPKLTLGGYEQINLSQGKIFYSPTERRAEVVVKRDPKGEITVCTDNTDVIKQVVESSEVVDIHIK